MARAPPLRPGLSALPHEVADVMIMLQRTQAALQAMETSQGSALRRLTAVEFHLGELQEQLGTSERRTAQRAEGVGDSVHNAHVRITDLQASLRAQDRVTTDLQQFVSQAATN